MKSGRVKVGDYVCMNDHDYSQGVVIGVNEHTEPHLLTVRLLYPEKRILLTTEDEVLNHSGQ